MSLILNPTIVCANFNCKKTLGDYELSRLSRRFNKYRFCPTCRRNPYIQLVKCVECGDPLPNGTQAHFCKPCIKKRRNMQNKERLRLKV